MSQQPGENPLGGWNSPPPEAQNPNPGYSPPPGYGAPLGYGPPMGGPYTEHPSFRPPSRSGAPWWVWVLGGCGGCFLVALVAVVFAVNWTAGVVRSIAGAPVTAQTVQRDLGPDVPVYPKASLDVPTTRASTIMFRTMEKASRKRAGAMFRGVGMYFTSDKEQKVLNFYSHNLSELGWKRTKKQTQSNGGTVLTYKKGDGQLIVQVDGSSGRTTLLLMRGGDAVSSLFNSN